VASCSHGAFDVYAIHEVETMKLIGTTILDTGSGYNSQNAMRVRFGLRGLRSVDVEVTVLTKGGRKIVRLSNVDPKENADRWLIVRVDDEGNLVKESYAKLKPDCVYSQAMSISLPHRTGLPVN